MADSLKLINSFKQKPWAIKYIGRKLNKSCLDRFPEADKKGFSVELDWEGQAKHVSENYYDDSTFIHKLVVSVYADGAAAGRIKDVSAYHREHWHTTSNWQDHAERGVVEVRLPNDKEIGEYEELLESLTEGGTGEQLDALFSRLKYVVRESDGRVKVECCSYDKELKISFFNDDKTSVTRTLCIDLKLLSNVLDYSHVFAEVMYSPESRQELGLCNGSEPPELQYFLDLFFEESDHPLYQYFDASLEAWLYQIFNSCELYRRFMQIDQEIWWRDAWWRLRQLVSIECKVERNKDMPLTDLVGHVGRYLQSRTAENFKIDDGDDLYSGYIEPGVKRYLPFQTIEKNGIKWSYCKLSTDRAVINIAQSEAVGDLPYGVAVIPDVIDGCLVESVRSIGCCVPKPWRKVVFANDEIESDEDAEDIQKAILDDYILGNGDGSTIPDDYDLSIVYESTLTIGKGAFRGFSELEEVVILRNPTRLPIEIEKFAFEGCLKLKKITFSTSTINIWTRAFAKCQALTELCVECIGTVGDEAFLDCTALERVSANSFNSSGRLSEGAFSGCTSLRNVSLSGRDNYRHAVIERRAFGSCPNIERIELPSSVISIADDAFADCGEKCILCHSGDGFWFKGCNALGRIKIDVYWGGSVRYKGKIWVLSELLEELRIEKDRFIDALQKGKCLTEAIKDLVARDADTLVGRSC